MDVTVRRLYQLRDRWNTQSLAAQFLLAGGFVSLAAMAIVGFLVTSKIEDGVTRNSAATTALYVDSVIAPTLPPTCARARCLATLSRVLSTRRSPRAPWAYFRFQGKADMAGPPLISSRLKMTIAP